VRSTAVVLPRNQMEDHALEPAAAADVSTALAGGFDGAGVGSTTGAFRTRNVASTPFACGVFRKS